MNEIITERFEGILRVELNRPAKKKRDDFEHVRDARGCLQRSGQGRTHACRALAWRRRFVLRRQRCGGFSEESSRARRISAGRLMNALLDFDKPLIAAVQGAAIGGGTTMLTHCDFVYAGESAKFQMPFINLAVVPEFGSSCSVPARIGHIRAAELILLGLPFDARRAADLGFVTQVVPDQNLLATANETARSWQRSRPARCKPASDS